MYGGNYTCTCTCTCRFNTKTFEVFFFLHSIIQWSLYHFQHWIKSSRMPEWPSITQLTCERTTSSDFLCSRYMNMNMYMYNSTHVKYNTCTCMCSLDKWFIINWAINNVYMYMYTCMWILFLYEKITLLANISWMYMYIDKFLWSIYPYIFL